MEHEELPEAPGSFRFGIYAPQQIQVALRIEHDDDFAPTNVLGDEKLGKPGLSDPGGAKNQRVSYPIPDFHPDIGLRRLNAMDRRIAA